MISKICMASLALKYNNSGVNNRNSKCSTFSATPNFGAAQDKFIKTLSLKDAIQALLSKFEPGEIKFSSPELDKNGLLDQMFLKYKVYNNDTHAVSLDFVTEQGKPNGHETLLLGSRNKVQEDLKSPDFIVKIQNVIDDFIAKRERSAS